MIDNKNNVETSEEMCYDIELINEVNNKAKELVKAKTEQLNRFMGLMKGEAYGETDID